jgi:hypothetical protein
MRAPISLAEVIPSAGSGRWFWTPPAMNSPWYLGVLSGRGFGTHLPRLLGRSRLQIGPGLFPYRNPRRAREKGPGFATLAAGVAYFQPAPNVFQGKAWLEGRAWLRPREDGTATCRGRSFSGATEPQTPSGARLRSRGRHPAAAGAGDQRRAGSWPCAPGGR